MLDYELVIVSYKSRSEIDELTASLPDDVPLVVVDNAGNVDGLREWSASRGNARYVDGGGRGFAHGANLGARSSSYDVVVFVNPDARPTIDVLDSLVADVRTDERCAASEPLTVTAAGRTEIGGWEPTVPRALIHAVGAHRLAPHSGIVARPQVGESITVDWAQATCMAVRRDTFLDVGPFDEGYFVYCEDVAWCRAVRENGMYVRARTDLVVPHGASGSGAPRPEMMRLNGASLSHYIRAHNPPAASRVIVAALAGGFVARAVPARIQGKRGRSREFLAYARGMLTGRAFVGDTEVAASRAEERRVSWTP